ncbi:MAG: GDSL-type esterase/lipase family protein [Solirubrobacterales bacterium]
MKPRAHFYGDSFTAGQGDPEQLGWVGRLAARLPEIDFANHGVPGAPGSYVAQTFVNTTIDRSRVELAVFCFGTNDAVLHHPAEQSLAALTESLDRAIRHDVPAIVIGPPPIGDMPEEDRVLRSLSDAFAGVCAARDVPFVATFDRLGPGSTWRAEAAAGDGSHPGAGGYIELAEFLDAEGLTAWLTKMSSR